MTTVDSGFLASETFPANASPATRNIITAYRTAYAEFYQREADKCQYLGGDWYLINGIPRERDWVLDETQRLQDAAQRRAREEKQHSTRLNILRLIRKISGI